MGFGDASLFSREAGNSQQMMNKTPEGTVHPWALLSLLPVHRCLSTAQCFDNCHFITLSALWLPPFCCLSDTYIKETPLEATRIVWGFVLSFWPRTKLKFLPLHNFTVNTITWISHGWPPQWHAGYTKYHRRYPKKTPALPAGNRKLIITIPWWPAGMLRQLFAFSMPISLLLK